jgi:hypothetical protein
MSKISVIIPCGNLGRFVDDAIDSAVNQILDEHDLEVIVVDDASEDSTPDVCRKWHDAITYIRNSEHLHVSRSRNIGISASSGDYIVCLDADDMLADGALQSLARSLDRDRMLDIVYGSMEVIEEDGRTWISGWPPRTFSYEAQLSGRDQIPTCSMYRRKVWERVGGYRPTYERVEDALFYTQAVAIGFVPLKVTEAVTLRYRLRKDSLSHRVAEKTWHTLAPRKPQWTPYTYEPIQTSVVIPVQPGQEEAAIRTIDSVWAQTLPAWECIVVSEEPLTYAPFVKNVVVPDLNNSAVKYDGGSRLEVPPGVVLENTILEKFSVLQKAGVKGICKRYWYPEDSINISLETCQDEGEVMPCGSCTSKTAALRTMPRSLAAMRDPDPLAIPSPSEGRILLEYIGDESSFPIKGKSTGEFYYFQAESGHKVKSVAESDANQFLALYENVKFKKYEEPTKPYGNPA